MIGADGRANFLFWSMEAEPISQESDGKEDLAGRIENRERERREDTRGGVSVVTVSGIAQLTASFGKWRANFSLTQDEEAHRTTNSVTVQSLDFDALLC